MFRSQTSDDMDRWKSRGGKSQRREEKKKEYQKRESLRRKKIQVREKVGKSWNTVFFQWFGAPEGRKVGSLKRRVRSPLGRWEMKNGMPLWREAHVEVKSVINWRSQPVFGSWDDEKMQAVVARSRFPSQNVQSTSCSDHFWKLRCRKSARRCGAKHISKSKVPKTDGYRALLEVQMSFCVAGAKGFAPCQKGAKTWGFSSSFRNNGKCGTLEEDLQRCFSRGTRNTRDMFIRDVRRSGLSETGCILEHQIFRFAKMILRDRRSTSYDLASLFRGKRSALNIWNGQIDTNSKTHWYEAVTFVLDFPF